MTTQSFIATKEHRRFAEFADAVRPPAHHRHLLRPGRHRKDPLRQAIRQLAQGREPHRTVGPRDDSDHQIYAALARARSVFYTPAVLTSPKQIHAELEHISTRVSICVDQHLEKIGKKTGPHTRTGKHVEPLIIDKSERLNATSLELLRDRYDRDNIALILIGMPGIEKWFSRYAQLYSRVGFAHEYRPLTQEELNFVLERRWHKLGQTLDPEDFTDAQAIAADDVIEAARSTLVIGIS